MFTVPCPTTWLPEQLAEIEMKKVRHCQPMYNGTTNLSLARWSCRKSAVSCLNHQAAWRSGNGVGRINEVTLRW